MSQVSHVTAHVLDAAAGRPAQGVGVRLERADGVRVAEAVTDADGRVHRLGPERLASGAYRVTFATGDYFAGRGVECFHPEVSILFTCDEDEAHYHIPLLLSPYSYTTYRGS